MGGAEPRPYGYSVIFQHFLWLPCVKGAVSRKAD